MLPAHFYSQSKKELSDKMLDPTFLHQMEYIIENTDSDSYDFSNMNDLDMIYYFIHSPKHVNRSIKESTKRSYLRELLSFYHHVRNHFTEGFKELTAIHIKEYQKYLKKSPQPSARENHYLPNTIQTKNTIIKSFLKWLYNVGYIERDVTRFMLSAAVRKEDQPVRDIKVSEVKKLIEYHRKHSYIGDYALISLFVTTGMRTIELARANWKDVFVDDLSGEIFLEVLGKRDKKRYVLLFDPVFKLVQKYRERIGYSGVIGEDPDSCFFPKPQGGPYNENYIGQRVTKLIHEALPNESKDRNLTAHSLRHGFANLLYVKGRKNLREIQEALGHEDPRTTEIYMARLQQLETHAALGLDVQSLFDF